ncbi:MAG TPA: hypothetical protein VEX37_02455 [Thermomicrobiales bacterium]|nr:hypothetical protein [Thermomicrobiales bacterium]
MSILIFLALFLVGYLAIMAVLGSILWCAVRLWQWRTGASIDIDAGIQHRHQQAGQDRAAGHA